MPSEEQTEKQRRRSLEAARKEAPLQAEYPSLNECPSWIAEKDLRIEALTENAPTTIVPSGENTKITFHLSKNDLPPVKLTPKILESLKVSTRSCVAQSGAFIYFDNQTLTPEQITALEAGNDVEIPATIKNSGPNPLEFRQNDAVARLYYMNPKDEVTGDKLRTLANEGIIKGKEGVDYVLLGKDHSNAIAIRVAQKRVYVPKMPPGKYLRVASRDELYKAVKEVDESTSAEDLEHSFYLLVTQPEVNLPDGVLGDLSMVTDKRFVTHLPSHLIDPGSRWVVRLEIHGGQADWVVMHFYRSELLNKINVAQKQETFKKGGLVS